MQNRFSTGETYLNVADTKNALVWFKAVLENELQRPENFRIDDHWAALAYCYTSIATCYDDINSVLDQRDAITHAQHALTCFDRIANKSANDFRTAARAAKLISDESIFFEFIYKVIFSTNKPSYDIKRQFDLLKTALDKPKYNGEVRLLINLLSLAVRSHRESVFNKTPIQIFLQDANNALFMQSFINDLKLMLHYNTYSPQHPTEAKINIMRRVAHLEYENTNLKRFLDLMLFSTPPVNPRNATQALDKHTDTRGFGPHGK